MLAALAGGVVGQMVSPIWFCAFADLGFVWVLSFGFRWVGCGSDLVGFFFFPLFGFLVPVGFWWVVGMVVVVVVW